MDITLKLFNARYCSSVNSALSYKQGELLHGQINPIEQKKWVFYNQ